MSTFLIEVFLFWYFYSHTTPQTKHKVPTRPVWLRNSGITGSDELFIVAEPYSEPIRPSSAIAKEDYSYIGNGRSEGLRSHMMFPKNESSSPSISASPGMSR